MTGKAEILGSEFADASDDGLEAARADVLAAEAASARLAMARETIAALVARGSALDREVDELGRVVAEAMRHAEQARVVAAEISALVEAIARADVGRSAAIATAGERAEAFAGAAAALADLEATWGDAVALAGRLERARALAAGRGVQAERRAEVAALAAAIPPAEAMAATATTTATDATTHERNALEAERAAVDALEAARAADRVAAVSAGLAVGDPCPVCGRPLESLPDRHGAPELAAATTSSSGRGPRPPRRRPPAGAPNEPPPTPRPRSTGNATGSPRRRRRSAGSNRTPTASSAS